ncbi:copper resistance system multicopper oxidase [Gemmatimonas sp.]|uniref:copper resistance system multicopper oxidase n=1 Tax=Gemmatimonas sp. TaxID=1962908 RepID=UPI003983322A
MDDEASPSDHVDLALPSVSRRRFLHAAGALGAMAGLPRIGAGDTMPAMPDFLRSRTNTPSPAVAGRVDLRIEKTPFGVAGRRGIATSINGTVPGPLLRFREGETATIHVTNRLKEDTSIHWHGLLVPNAMDGVPGINFPGIRPGQTFVYEFPLRQYGTYWYHSHSGFQEQLGHFGPLIIDPVEPEPFQYDREYVVMLSDWTFEDPLKILDNLKKNSTYYNYQRRTVGDFFRDVERAGVRATIADRLAWGKMRMSPIDIADVTGSTYTYLLNGLPAAENWTGLFRPGERVRLRFINAGAGSYFDVRIPGLEMTLVQASGQHVQPVAIDEFRIEIAQTYDVIVQPTEDRAYTIFAESMDRSGYTRGTLAPRAGMSAPIPARRPRPTLTMLDMGMTMGMGGHGGMAMPGMDTGDPSKQVAPVAAPVPTGHDMAGHDTAPSVMASAVAPGTFAGRLRDGTVIRTTDLRSPGTIPEPVMHSGDTHGAASAGTAMETRSRLHEPGAGLGEDGWRVLVYTDLKRLTPAPMFGPPAREVELHLTGNMERYMWSINGIKFSDVTDPIRLKHGERIRLTIVNDSMMAHPMHLHGVFMELENGHGAECPLIHTINVKPAERVSLLVTPVDPGPWAFHCHVLFHMDLGMFRVFHVSEPDGPLTTGEGDDV